MFGREENPGAMHLKPNGDLHQIGERLANRRLFFGLNDEKQKSAIAGSANLAAFGPGLPGAVVMKVNLGVGNRAGELAL